MTAEHLLIIFLTVACTLVLGFWRLDTARSHERFEAQEKRHDAKIDKLMDRLQSQVPAVLDRQDAHEERQAELQRPERETTGEEDFRARIPELAESSDMTAAEGRAAVATIIEGSKS